MEVEICCGDVEAVEEAIKGGAKRIELCSALSEGGVTPSFALIKYAVASGIPYVNVLIRPRSGNFLYSEQEIKLMEEDIKTAIEIGASGIVTGALTKDGEVDMDVMRRLMETALSHASELRISRPSFTFHRAFDMSLDPEKSLDDIITLGCNCLLTSGMASNAFEGIPMIKMLVKRGEGKIQIMAGSGITPTNAPEIIVKTGVSAIHSTARKIIPDGMEFRRNGVSMGGGLDDEYIRKETSREIVEKLIKCMESTEL